MANKNSNLQTAKNTKNDEFYTTYETIESEVVHYAAHFLGKTVLCNCDDPFESNFCKYFLKNFNVLGPMHYIHSAQVNLPLANRDA